MEILGGDILKIGIGYDVHKLVKGRNLIIGGVNIPFEKGLLGHSDADVLSHAINDALLGAACLGDIGKLFPDSDERFKDISSLKLVKIVGEKLSQDGYKILNIDSVICAERPKLAPYIDSMRGNIAKTLGLHIGQVSIKATTTEGLGFVGKGEGIAAQAVCLIRENIQKYKKAHK